MTWATAAAKAGGGTAGTPDSGTSTLGPTFAWTLGHEVPVFSTLEIHFVPEHLTGLLSRWALGDWQHHGAARAPVVVPFPHGGADQTEAAPLWQMTFRCVNPAVGGS